MNPPSPEPPLPAASVPTHVAIIMDGNGRWAQARGLPREEGHRHGVDNVQRILETARELDLRFLTLYAFSVENWKRPRNEVGALMRLLDAFLKSKARDLIDKEIRLRVLGQPDGLPDSVRQRLRETQEATRHFHRWNLCLALNYGARTETIDAVKAYAQAVRDGREDPQNLDWDRWQQYLYTADIPDPDLVIRTSGEHRVSNFLLLQSAYAEYYFSEKFWPDFDADAFREALRAYGSRQRRFGLTSSQLASSP